MQKIAPSILSADGADSAKRSGRRGGGGGLIHIDIMDGHFVPNLTIGPGLVASLRQTTRLPFDVHLMIENPESTSTTSRRRGATGSPSTWRPTVHLHRLVAMIREKGVRAGSPSTRRRPCA